MNHSKRIGMVAAVIGLALFAGGCVDRDVSGDTVTYDYAWWVPVLSLVAALVAFPVGLVLRKRSGRFGWGLMIVAPILAILVFPAMLLDKVKVDSNHFETHYGFWFAPTKHNVRFDDLVELRLVTYQERTRRGGRQTKQKFLCIYNSAAAKDTVQLNTLVKEAAEEIVRRAQAKGVTVTETDE